MAAAVPSSTPTVNAGGIAGATSTDVATATATAVPSVAHKHHPYDDMILNAIQALKFHKGSNWYAISKYISDNYSDLPPTHATLLTDHLRQLQSKGVIRMSKFCYKIEDGSRRRGRPPLKPTSSGEPRKRGRPPKLLSVVAATNKRKRGRPPTGTAPVNNGPVYIVSQAEQLSSGLLRNFPGAVAIVLPKSLLSEKAAKSPILILPKGIQSLVDASSGKKLGRPKNVDRKKKRGRPKKKAVLSKQEVGIYGVGNGKPVNFVAKGPGRPWKIRDLLVPAKTADLSERSGEPRMLGRDQGTQETTGLEVKKRSVGRPRKKPLLEGPNPPSDVLVK